jgi:hypothetical protein
MADFQSRTIAIVATNLSGEDLTEVSKSVFALYLRATSEIQELPAELRNLKNIIIFRDFSEDPMDWVCKRIQSPDLDLSGFDQVDIYGVSNETDLVLFLNAKSFDRVESTDFGCRASKAAG